MSRRHLPPAEPFAVQARRIARDDGERAAQWVAQYVAGHDRDPRWSELAGAMGWDPKLAWQIIGRLKVRGLLSDDSHPGALRPGPAARSGNSAGVTNYVTIPAKIRGNDTGRDS